jgi:hypothetical protein
MFNSQPCGNPQKAYLVAMALDALSIAAMFRATGDTAEAKLFVAMSAGYMARAKRDHANG